AVDIPSGLDGRTGGLRGNPWTATATITFAALKSGLVLGHGPELCGRVEVADIGLSVAAEVGSGDGLARGLVGDADVRSRWPRRPPDAHKWSAAVWIIGGAPGMTGAAALTAEAAGRAGAGYVLVSAPPVDGDRRTEPGLPHAPLPVESVVRDLPSGAGSGGTTAAWAEAVADEDRVGALVIGNGLGRDRVVIDGVLSLLELTDTAVVLDADALSAGGAALLDVCARRSAITVLTPHDGEYEALMGEAPGDDRLAAASRLAERSGAIALLKGPTTVIADPDGRIRLSTAGDQRLATAGTGDVLAGIVGAGLARASATSPAADPLDVVAAAAHVHGRAAERGHRLGFRAGDLPDLVAVTLDRLVT
ncbi:MAG: NAD(P)H-hydrate dehydratase, partial [Microthrixaceae bacterium]|nr:NAD(P)H-hydrate dehydratase [Microthrixaceae bacterium]